MPNTVERAQEILENLGNLTEGTQYEDLDDFLVQSLSRKDSQTVGSLQGNAGYLQNVFEIDRNQAVDWLFTQKVDLQEFYDFLLTKGDDSWGREPRKWIHEIMVSKNMTPPEILELYDGYIFLLRLITAKCYWEWSINP